MVKILKAPKDNNNVSKSVVEMVLASKEFDEIRFEKGVYHFYSDGCYTDMFCTTNNDSGIKNVVFPILNKKNLTIDGQGSTFVIHEEVYPFIIQNSENITLKNFQIDYACPVYAYGEVEEWSEKHFILHMRVDEDCSKYYINEENNIVFFNEEREFSSASMHFIAGEFNPSERRMETDTWLRFFCVGKQDKKVENPAVPVYYMDATDLGNYRVKFSYHEGSQRTEYKVGNAVLIMYRDRQYGNIFIDKSKNTCIENINIFRGVGMGVLAQNSENITIDRLAVKPKAERFGAMSITADCVHILNCRGRLNVTNSWFERSFDDPLNVHGMYTVVDQIISENKILVRLMHQDQRYINVYSPGDVISVIDHETSEITERRMIKSSQLTEDGACVILESAEKFENIRQGMYLENSEAMPTVYYANNLLKDAPRLLCATPKKAVIEKNIFDGMGNPIFITDCPSYWYESGRVEELFISQNRFLRSCYKGSRCPIMIKYENDQFKDNDTTIHKNITITENQIENADCAIVEASYVDHLVIANNSVRSFPGAKRLDKEQIPYQLTCCKNVTIENNTIEF